MKFRRYRALAALVFVLLAAAGLVWHTGWGTASSFGIADIAAVCPLGSLEAMLAEKTLLPRALAALAVFILAAALLGRFFCGWLCPIPWAGKLASLFRRRRPRRLAAAAAESGRAAPAAEAACASGAASASQPSAAASACAACSLTASACRSASCASGADGAPSGAAEKTPYVILGGALASSAVFGFPVFCLVCPVGLFFALVIALWRLFEFNETNWSILWFAAFLVLELFVLRRWCHRFCPLGALMTIAARLNRTLRPKASEALCTRHARGTDCHACRDACPEGIDPAAAASGQSPWLLARCTKCGACAAACPSSAIRFPFLAKAGEEKAGGARVIPIADASAAASCAAASSDPAPALPLCERRTTFNEVRGVLGEDGFAKELARCVHCGSCASRCPLGLRMAEALSCFAKGDEARAAKALFAPGAMPEVCGRVCPSERLCESACAEGMPGGERAVGIAALERSAADRLLAAGWRPDARRTLLKRRVAVVGAGPAGLACADVLARLGVEVHVIDAAPEAGGLLAFGIPAFKLPRSVVRRRRALLEGLGVKFALGLRAGRDVEWKGLAEGFDAVFLGLGAGRPVPLHAPGAVGPGVLQAADFLARRARLELGLAAEEASAEPARGRRVAVLGGGDTALDCARTALREGAASVVCICRRREADLRARPEDVRAAKEEGVALLCELEAAAVLRDAEGRAAAVECESTASPNAPRQSVPAELVIVAYGFRGEADSELESLGVEFDGRGCVRVDADGRTGAAKIWAGGDLVRGPSLVSEALADGCRAGFSMAQAMGVIKA